MRNRIRHFWSSIRKSQWSPVATSANIPIPPSAQRLERHVLVTLMAPFRAMFLATWLHVLLIFVPVGIMAGFLRLSPIVIFVTNSLAIVPLSALLTEATEVIASQAGDTIGALLNISLGNLVELIIL